MLRPVRGPLLCTALAFCAHGCGIPYVERELVPPSLVDERTDLEGRFLEAHLHDGSVVVFSHWGFDASGDHLIGEGETFDPHRRSQGVAEVSLDIREIALVETNVIERSNRLGGLAILYGLTAAAAIHCLTQPKACFGSCPTFYVEGETGKELRAEGFSASVAPVLEATDRDALGVVPVDGGRIVVTMKNEAFETHVVRWADLEVAISDDPREGTRSIVRRDPGTDVVATPAGELLRTGAATPPARCHDGVRDWSEEVRAFDGWMRSVRADSTDLAAREELTLTFVDPPKGRLGLVVSARQSLVSTYVFYQALAWMGRDVGYWLARLERARPEERAAFRGPGEVLGRIEVEVRRSDGSWVPLGECGETGPLATDSWCLPFPEDWEVADREGASPPSGRAGTESPRMAQDRASTDPASPTGNVGPIEVRLRAARGMWRYDRLALVALEGPAETVRLRPAEVWREGRRDETAEAALLDDAATLVAYPGDVYELVYSLPRTEAGDPTHACAMLESRGYYLEGMREEWLTEEDPARLVRLFLDPRGTLREIAPAFHAVEEEMERTFWSSQYVAP